MARVSGRTSPYTAEEKPSNRGRDGVPSISEGRIEVVAVVLVRVRKERPQS